MRATFETITAPTWLSTVRIDFETCVVTDYAINDSPTPISNATRVLTAGRPILLCWNSTTSEA